MMHTKLFLFLLFVASATTILSAQVAVVGETVYTMAGEPLQNATVLITDGKIATVGPTDEVEIPAGYETLSAKVVTPGLIDAHCTVGTSGIFNIEHDQDQLERAEPIQPELRALDAYNAADRLVDWVRGFGVTTIHTGHAPGELVSGQTLIVKTKGNTVEEATVAPATAVAVTLTSAARKSDQKSPGTRGKMLAMLREQLIKAQEYQAKLSRAAQVDDEEEKQEPDRDLRLEALVRVLQGELKLMITADRAQDISSALRLAEEFDLQIWLDSAAESYLVIDDIKTSGAAVLIHPTMARAVGERENMSFETAARLREAGIPVAMQSGYEAYVPKTRVVLFEAGQAAANGLSFEEALGIITIDSAKILGIDGRVGSLEVGKDGDVAMYDGDPFEYTTHCTGVIINGEIVSNEPR
ncbi:MAG: amidohydrolase family protein [Planctomycetota bacterium]